MKARLRQATLLGLLGLGALTGCGSHNTADSSIDLSSTGTPGANDRGGNSGKPTATCNKIVQGDLEVRLMAYTDANNIRNNSLIRLKFVHVPDEYISGNYDIQIRKWTASATGVVRPANTEAPFYVNTRIDLKSNGLYQPASTWNYNLACDTCPTLQWSNMQLIASANGGQTFNNANTFFEKFQLLLDLEDSAGDWKALQIIFMNGNVPVKYVNMLIPSFDANPADYKATHPLVLSNLHPLLSMLDQGFPSTQYQTESNSYCF